MISNLEPTISPKSATSASQTTPASVTANTQGAKGASASKINSPNIPFVLNELTGKNTALSNKINRINQTLINHLSALASSNPKVAKLLSQSSMKQVNQLLSQTNQSGNQTTAKQIPQVLSALTQLTQKGDKAQTSIATNILDLDTAGKTADKQATIVNSQTMSGTFGAADKLNKTAIAQKSSKDVVSNLMQQTDANTQNTKTTIPSSLTHLLSGAFGSAEDLNKKSNEKKSANDNASSLLQQNSEGSNKTTKAFSNLTSVLLGGLSALDHLTKKAEAEAATKTSVSGLFQDEEKKNDKKLSNQSVISLRKNKRSDSTPHYGSTSNYGNGFFGGSFDGEYNSQNNSDIYGNGLIAMAQLVTLVQQLATSEYAAIQSRSDYARDAAEQSNNTDAAIAAATAADPDKPGTGTATLPQSVIDFMRKNNILVNGQTIDAFMKAHAKDGGKLDIASLKEVKGALDAESSKATDFSSQAQLQIQKVIQEYTVGINAENSLQSSETTLNKGIIDNIR